MFSIFASWGALEVILGIIAVAGVIIIVGSRLTKIADELAQLTGLSSSWIGIIFLALITSMPELVSSVTAVATGSPDIGIGNVFGSNMFNMFIIAILDFLQGPGPLMLSVSATQILPAALGIFLMAMAAIGIFAAESMSLGSASEGIGWFFSVLIFAAWIIGTYIIFKSEQETVSDEAYFRRRKKAKIGRLIAEFSVNAFIIIIAGILLIGLAEQLSHIELALGSFRFSLKESFIGTMIVAVITSLPELVVSISAYRIGAINMAIANLFGSNTYNMVLIPIMDVVGRKSVLAAASPVHILAAGFGIVLISIAIMGVIYRSRKSFLYLGWDALAIFALYLFGAYMLFQVAIQPIQGTI